MDSSFMTTSSLVGEAMEVVPVSIAVHAAYVTCLACLDGVDLEDLSGCCCLDDDVGWDGIVRE